MANWINFNVVGGVKANCVLPQDQADNTAPYDPALKVYWRSFVVA